MLFSIIVSPMPIPKIRSQSKDVRIRDSRIIYSKDAPKDISSDAATSVSDLVLAFLKFKVSVTMPVNRHVAMSLVISADINLSSFNIISQVEDMLGSTILTEPK